MIGPEKNSAQVLVVGAGPTGLMMAGEFAHFGVSCRIIDKAPHPSTVSKALGVQARTLECFARVGLAERTVAAGHPVHGLNVFSEGKRIVHVSLDQIDSPYPFVLALSQRITEQFLEQHLERQGVSVERNVELLRFTQGEEGIDSILQHVGKQEEERFRVPWIIGCDGPHSAVRHQLGIPFSGSAFPEAFGLADVSLDGNVPDDEVTIYLTHGDVVGLIPMNRNRAYRIVIQHHSATEHTSEPTLDEFQQALRRCGRSDLRVSNPIWMSRFHISQRLVAHYRKGRVFLAGDSAHIHSPLGGQGMNTGIQDACNLAWKLALVIQGRGRPELLDSYDKERHPLGETLLRTTGALSQVILWRTQVAEAVRDRIASFLTSFEAVQDRIPRGVSESGIRYRHSPIVAEDRARGWFAGWLSSEVGPRAGDRAVDAVLGKSDGSSVRLFDLLAAPRHTLLLFSGWKSHSEDSERRQGFLDEIRRDFGEGIGTFVIGGEAELQQQSRAAEVLLDSSGSAHRAYGAEEVLYLIRPDGYVGYRGQPPDAAKLLGYLKRIFV